MKSIKDQNDYETKQMWSDTMEISINIFSLKTTVFLFIPQYSNKIANDIFNFDNNIINYVKENPAKSMLDDIFIQSKTTDFETILQSSNDVNLHDICQIQTFFDDENLFEIFSLFVFYKWISIMTLIRKNNEKLNIELNQIINDLLICLNRILKQILTKK